MTHKISLEYVKGSSAKFWQAEVNGAELTVRYGRVGTNGQTRVKSLADRSAALKEYKKLVQAKRKKGYVETASRATVHDLGEAAEAQQQQAPGVELSVEVLRKTGRVSGTYFWPVCGAGNGDDLYIHGRHCLLYSKAGARFKKCDTYADVAGWKNPKSHPSVTDWDTSMVACNDEIFMSGKGAVRFSAGYTDVEQFIESNTSIELAANGAGAIWAGGRGPNGAVLSQYEAKRDKWKKLTLPAEVEGVRRMLAAGDELYFVSGTRLWRFSGRSAEPLFDFEEGAIHIAQTAAGTLLAITGSYVDEVFTVWRSTNGGKKFQKTAVDTVVQTLCQMPGGPIVAGGAGDYLAVSSDDGRSFVPLEHNAGSGESFAVFEFSFVHQGAVILGGNVQNVVCVRPQPEPTVATAVSTTGAKRKKPPTRNKRGGSGYIASGKFAADLKRLLGPLKPRRKKQIRAAETNADLERLPIKQRQEVDAFLELCETHKMPRLCGLELGSFTSVPTQFGLDADGVREEEWFFDDEDIQLVVDSVELFRDAGSPSVIVGEHGVALFHEDPHGYVVIADTLEAFLKVILNLEAAAQGRVSANTAEALLYDLIYGHEDNDESFCDFFMRTLNKAIS